MNNMPRNCYITRLSPTKVAIADLCEYEDLGWIITRINVPEGFRSLGHGRNLLTHILADADEHKVTLWLEVLASGGLTSDQLYAWYRRYGFRGHMMLRRRPHTKEPIS